MPEGAFGDGSGMGFSFGGGPIAFNPARGTLFIGQNKNLVAEVSIPPPVNSPTIATLPFATVLQPFADPTEGQYGTSGSDGTIPSSLEGLLVTETGLQGSGAIYYDANDTTAVSHFTRSTSLTTPSFAGWQALWQAGGQGYVGRAMAAVPQAWQALLGGSVLASGWGLPIISRQSNGPDAFSFTPAAGAMMSATPLLNYPNDHPTLGAWATANTPVYNQASDYGGLVIVPNTRSALYFGRTGQGPPCYGQGTPDPTLNGQPDPSGSMYCYDPLDSDKGTHAYPYSYYVWAYDLKDFAAVKAGTKQPWDVLPYASWTLTLPMPAGAFKNLYATIDPATSTIYVSQVYVDPGAWGYFAGPFVHVFTVQ